MKKIVWVLALVFMNLSMDAQIKTPAPSPKATIMQTVGLTEVEVVYSRPSAKSRPVFGNLVPFGKLWRTGANANTTISFSDDVIIGGKTLKKGKYALYTIPKIGTWEILFYTTTDNWGNPEEFKETNVALRTTVNEVALSKPVETFTIGINTLDANYGHLDIAWENSSVSIKFEVPTQKIANSSIDKVMAGPAASDYFSASQYIFNSNGDLEKSRTYIDKALDMSTEKPFWYLRHKSLVQAKQGDKKAAIETAKASLAAAEVAKNQDYVKMNQDSISEWSKK